MKTRGVLLGTLLLGLCPVSALADPEGPGPRKIGLSAERERIVWDGLESTGRSVGLGRGELLSAAESTEARAALPRNEGWAIVVVDVDANGRALSAAVASASSDRESWTRTAAALVEGLRGKRVAAAHGPWGTRFTLELVHRERYPSGNRTVVSLCGVGMGIVICFDPVDLFAHRATGLWARIVAEEPLHQ